MVSGGFQQQQVIQRRPIHILRLGEEPVPGESISTNAQFRVVRCAMPRTNSVERSSSRSITYGTGNFQETRAAPTEDRSITKWSRRWGPGLP